LMKAMAVTMITCQLLDVLPWWVFDLVANLTFTINDWKRHHSIISIVDCFPLLWIHWSLNLSWYLAFLLPSWLAILMW
jgi:hypothetical protein